jgi:VWFA-related protein
MSSATLPAALAVALAFSQAGQQTPVFRTRINVVPLTVTVLDRDGAPVTGLRQSDFTIIEDGEPREIVTFYSQATSFVPQPALAQADVTLDRTDRDPTAPQTRRTFLLVLGHGRIQYPTRAIDGARAFVGDHLLPQDLVAVLAFNRATDFTTDHASITRFLDRYEAENERLEFDIDQYWVHHRYEPLSDDLQSRIEALFLGPAFGDARPGEPARHDGSMRNATAMLLGMDDAAAGVTTTPWEAPATLNDVSRAARRSRWRLADLMIGSGALKVYAGLEYLRHVAGQKHVVFLGPGLGLQSKEDEERLARRFNHAGATLHMIRTTGVAAHNVGARAAAQALASLSDIQGQQHVTAQTGGYYTGVTYADKALASIDRASRASYVIGYVPANAELDGKYRDVVVRVARPDIVVRSPGGYYAADRPDALLLDDLITQSRLDAALATDVTEGDIKVTGEVVFTPSPDGGEVSVTGRINASRLTFTRAGRLMSVRLGLSAEAIDSDRRSLGEATGRLSIDANPQAYIDYSLLGVPYAVRLAVTSRPRSIKVVVYDYGSDLVGTVVLPVK